MDPDICMAAAVLSCVPVFNMTDQCGFRAVIDSGATHTAVGKRWANEYFSSLNLPTIATSERKFRFGDSRMFSSMGEIKIPICMRCINEQGFAAEYNCIIQADMVNTDIPLRVSRRSLQHTQSSINFDVNELTIQSTFRVSLQLAENGHLLIPLVPPGRRKTETLAYDGIPSIFTQDAVDVETPLPYELVRKVHLQLARINALAMKRLFESAGRKVEMSVLGKVVQDCQCIQQQSHAERPIAKSYVPLMSGHTLFADIFPPLEVSGRFKKNPYLMITCGLSRFCVCRPLKRMLPGVVIEAIVQWRFQYFGRCSVLISDKGPGFVGPQWGEFRQAYQIAHIGVPTLAAHSNGLVERKIGLLKEGYRVCKERYPNWGDADILRHVAVARNLMPLLSTGVPPMTAMTGRCDLLAALEDGWMLDS